LASDGEGYCALLRNGEARCWGDNTVGELGDGNTASVVVWPWAKDPGGVGRLPSMAVPAGTIALPLHFDSHHLEYVAAPSGAAVLTQLMNWSVGYSAKPQVVSATSNPDLFGIQQAGLLPDGRALVVLAGRSVWLWMLKTGRINRMNDSGFSLGGGGQLVALSTEEGQLSVWDERPADDPYFVVTTTYAAPTIVLSPDGSQVLVNESNSGDNVLSVYPCGDCGAFARVLDLARSHIVRPLTAAEQKAYLSSS
jgi:hypothetical protein